MEVKDYKPGDENAILALFKLVFKKEMNLNYWKWRFELNPAGAHFIKLMWIDDLLVGHYAVSPVKMNVFGKVEMTALSMTTMTHPEYGGKGIFNKLALKLYDELETQKGFTAIWGFPNRNSHYGFIKNLGWSDVGVIHNLTMQINISTSKQSQNIKESKNFSDKHERKLNELSSSFNINVIKDVKYLNWRYSLNPSQGYTVFDYEDGIREGFIVTKIYPSNTQSGYYDLYLMELGLKKDQLDLMKTFIDHIMHHYNVSFDRVHIWLNLWDERHIILEKMGFFSEGRSTFLGIRNNTDNEGAANLKNWSYSFGDSDVY